MTALCPAFVDTPMTEYVKEPVEPDEMIRPEDIAEAVRFLLRTSPACLVPEIVFMRPGAAQRPELAGAGRPDRPARDARCSASCSSAAASRSTRT